MVVSQRKAPFTFGPGQLVMAKFNMYGFHPAVILADAHVPSDVVQELTRFAVEGQNQYYVFFLADGSFGLCGPDHIKTLTSKGASELKKQKKYQKHDMLVALEEAESYTSYSQLLIDNDLIHEDDAENNDATTSGRTFHTPPPPPTTPAAIPQSTTSKRRLTSSSSPAPSPAEEPLARKRITTAPSLFPFCPGDIILATFPDFALWPAMVVADCHVSDQIKRTLSSYRKPGLTYCYVVFFGDRNFGTCTESDIREVSKRQIMVGARDKRSPYKQPAYKDASSFPSYWNFMLQVNRVSKDDTPYELKSIYELPPGVEKSVNPSSRVNKVSLPASNATSTSRTSSSSPAPSTRSPKHKSSTPASSSISTKLSSSAPSTTVAQSKTAPTSPVPGQLVMAQYVSFSAYPAVVMANCHVSEEKKKALKQYLPKGSDYCYVLFMGERTIGVCSYAHVTPLSKERALKKKMNSKKKSQLRALEDALRYENYWSLLSEEEIVSEDESPYVLGSIYDAPPSVKSTGRRTAFTARVATSTSKKKQAVASSASPSTSSTTPSKLPSTSTSAKYVSTPPVPEPIPVSRLTTIHPGDLVLALFESMHWLPAVVVADCHVPQLNKDALESHKLKDDSYAYVVFLGDHDFGVCRISDQLTAFTKPDQKTISYNKITKRAYAEASRYTSYWNFLIENQVVEKDEVPYQLSGIHDCPPLNKDQKAGTSSANVSSSQVPSTPTIGHSIMAPEDDPDSDSEPEVVLFPFVPGTLVTARFSAFPWLPAVVMADCHVPVKTIEELKSFRDDLGGDISGYVMFLGDHSFGVCPTEDLKLLQKSEAILMCKRSLAEPKMSGYLAAANYVNYWSLLIDCGIVSKSDIPYTLTDISELPPLAQRKRPVERIPTIPSNTSSIDNNDSLVAVKQELHRASMANSKIAEPSTIALPSKAQESTLLGSLTISPNYTYKPGDLVLARLEGYPSWPAVVIANHHMSERNRLELHEQKITDDVYYYVMFLGDHDFGVSPCFDLEPLTRNKATEMALLLKKSGKSKKSKLLVAAAEASSYNSYWDLLVESNLVGDDETPYILKTIDDIPPEGSRASTKFVDDDYQEKEKRTRRPRAPTLKDTDPFPFCPGDLVLCPFEEHPSWPAIVLATCHVSDSVRNELELESDIEEGFLYGFVCLMGSRKISICSASELRELDEDKALKMMGWKRGLPLELAVVDAFKFEDDYWSFLIEMGIVNKADRPYELKTVNDTPPDVTKARTISPSTGSVVRRSPSAEPSAPFPFVPGDLVLAKFSSSPMWPSVVIADCHVPDDIRQFLEKRSKRRQYCYVLFLGDREYGICSADDVKPFSRQRALNRAKWKQEKRLAEACQDASCYLNYWNLLLEMKLVDVSEKRYYLSSIHELPPRASKNKRAEDDLCSDQPPTKKHQIYPVPGSSENPVILSPPHSSESQSPESRQKSSVRSISPQPSSASPMSVKKDSSVQVSSRPSTPRHAVNCSEASSNPVTKLSSGPAPRPIARPSSQSQAASSQPSSSPAIRSIQSHSLLRPKSGSTKTSYIPSFLQSRVPARPQSRSSGLAQSTPQHTNQPKRSVTPPFRGTAIIRTPSPPCVQITLSDDDDLETVSAKTNTTDFTLTRPTRLASHSLQHTSGYRPVGTGIYSPVPSYSSRVGQFSPISERSFKPGDLVAAEFEQQNEYPGVVLADFHVPEKEKNRLQGDLLPGEENIFILFMGDRNFGVVQAGRLTRLTVADAQRLSQDSHLSQFKREAYGDASHYSGYWNLLLERGLVSSGERPYFLSGIHDTTHTGFG